MQEIKSHVYIPKSILNRFSYRDKDNRILIDYLDLNTMNIYNSTTANFNRIKGYYQETVELILKNEAEDKIGNIIAKLENNRKNGIETLLEDKELDIIYSFIAYQWIRNDNISSFIMKNENFKEDIKEFKNLNILIESKLNIFKDVANKMGIIIYFNNTSRNFILPSNFTYTINPNSNDMYVMYANLSNKISIAFCSMNMVKSFDINNNKKYYIANIDNDKFVSDLNIKAIAIDKKNNSKFIVGYKTDLQKMIQLIKDN